jgi:hypothetical protein
MMKSMDILENILGAIFRVDSIWSVVARAVVWFAVATVVIISVDNPDTEKSLKNLKSNLGFAAMFLVLSGGLVYLLFGFQPGV